MSARDRLWELVHAALDERRDPLADARVHRALAEAPECALELVRVLDGLGALARARRRRRSAIAVATAAVLVLASALGAVPALTKILGGGTSRVERSANAVAQAASPRAGIAAPPARVGPPQPLASAIVAMRSEVTRERVEASSPSASRARRIVRVHATRLSAGGRASETRHELLAVVDHISFAE